MLKYALITLFVWAHAVLAAGPVIEVDRPEVNIRADATVQSVRIAVLDEGKRVERVAQKDEWNQIRLPDGRLGWLHGNLVREIWTVTGERVRVRTAGSTEAPTAAIVEQGSELALIGRAGRWLEVEMLSGERGWIWKELVKPLDFIGTNDGEASKNEAQIVAVASEDTVVQNDEATVSNSLPEGSILNPYAEGLQRFGDGDYAGALAAFEQVLADDPGHIRALLHAARAHRELGQYDAGIEKLYRAAGQGEGHRELAKMYRAIGVSDSAAKYNALARGVVWTQVADEDVEITQKEGPEVWVWSVLAGVAAVICLGLIFFVRGLRRKKQGIVDETPRSKFARAVEKARPQDISKGSGEEKTLERQIEEKRSALRASAAAFAPPSEQANEDVLMDGLLGQVDTFRQALEAQDERAKMYAELVRMQTQKIEILEQELQLLRRRKR